jgi:DNA-binding MarR family transcriptional regulator
MVHFRVRDKILVHLLQYSNYVDRGEYPVEMTQEGIAEAVGILVSHVPRNVKKLRDEGLVVEDSGRVRGKTRRVKVYYLTSRGILAAREMMESMEKHIAEVTDGRVHVRDLLERGVSPVDIMSAVEEGRVEELASANPLKTESEFHVEYMETLGEEEGELMDREEDLQRLMEWYHSGVPTAVVTGGKGYGKTMLIKKFVREIDHDGDMVYLIMHSNRTIESVLNAISEAAGREFRILKDLVDWMEERNVLLIADEYYLAPEETVEFFRDLVRVPRSRSRLLVGMRDATPFYCRFCSADDFSAGRAVEIHLREFGMEQARTLFPSAEEGALRRILGLTKGHPQALILLSRGDSEGLKRMGTLTPEEVSLLMYLAGF